MAAKYVDGFVFVLKKKNVPAYLKMAKEGAAAWKKFGALDYMECIGDDMKPKSVKLPFTKLTECMPGEVVGFSYITFKSRAHRDQVNAKVMKYLGEKYADQKDFFMPFDDSRMAYGGFSVIVSA